MKTVVPRLFVHCKSPDRESALILVASEPGLTPVPSWLVVGGAMISEKNQEESMPRDCERKKAGHDADLVFDQIQHWLDEGVVRVFRIRTEVWIECKEGLAGENRGDPPALRKPLYSRETRAWLAYVGQRCLQRLFCRGIDAVILTLHGYANFGEQKEADFEMQELFDDDPFLDLLFGFIETRRQGHAAPAETLLKQLREQANVVGWSKSQISELPRSGAVLSRKLGAYHECGLLRALGIDLVRQKSGSRSIVLRRLDESNTVPSVALSDVKSISCKDIGALDAIAATLDTRKCNSDGRLL